MRDLKVRPTRITLQLANKSIKLPHVVVKDVLVSVGELTCRLILK